jgi:MarR family transcriptional regulator, lower aerobic nicotinate degradation pathway regulator
VRLVDSLVQLSFLIQAVLGRVAARYDLSIIQVRLLGVLRGREPGMLELAAYLNIDKSSLSGLVDRAQERGLVRRIKVPADQRAVHVGLTARGKELAAKFAGEVEERLLGLVEVLDADERRQISALAMQIVTTNEGRQR